MASSVLRPPANSSMRPIMDSSDDSGIDATLKLIAELALQDIIEVTQSRKGKGRSDAPLSDEEIAFQAQREAFESDIRAFNDYVMAKSIHDAIDSDNAILHALSAVEQGEQDDRDAARALEVGAELPPPSQAQVLLGDADALKELASEPEPAIPDPIEANPEIFAADGPVSSSSKIPTVTLEKQESSPKDGTYQTPSTQCTVCGDLIRGSDIRLTGPCGHDYCGTCISDLVKASTRDESLYPPRCCNQPFRYADLVQCLALDLLIEYNVKRLELDVPVLNRVYCPNPKCSAFLGSSELASDDILCERCDNYVCPKCRQQAHGGESCSENETSRQVRELADSEHWQTCPGCKNIVELSVGCYHMTCLCRFQFCYLCANAWKSCSCPQWDEHRLLDTAQLRVQQEAVGQAPVAPIVYHERVRRMANTLRDNHNCVRHAWRRRNGSGHCEECGHWLRDFLLNCKQCHLMACVRCARNRL